jgi:hypothetical protein
MRRSCAPSNEYPPDSSFVEFYTPPQTPVQRDIAHNRVPVAHSTINPVQPVLDIEAIEALLLAQELQQSPGFSSPGPSSHHFPINQIGSGLPAPPPRLRPQARQQVHIIESSPELSGRRPSPSRASTAPSSSVSSVESAPGLEAIVAYSEAHLCFLSSSIIHLMSTRSRQNSDIHLVEDASLASRNTSGMQSGPGVPRDVTDRNSISEESIISCKSSFHWSSASVSIRS